MNNYILMVHLPDSNMPPRRGFTPRNTSQHAVLIEVYYAFSLVLSDDFDHLSFKLSRVPIYH